MECLFGFLLFHGIVKMLSGREDFITDKIVENNFKFPNNLIEVQDYNFMPSLHVEFANENDP